MTDRDPSAATPSTKVEAILDSSIGREDNSRDIPLERYVSDHDRFKLNRLVDLARACGADNLFVVPAAQLQDCRPFKSEPLHDCGLDWTL